MPTITFITELPYRTGIATSTFRTEEGARIAARLTGGEYIGPRLEYEQGEDSDETDYRIAARAA